MTTLSYHKISRWTAACVAAIALSSCGTHKMNYDFRELAVAAITLDMDIEMNDNHRLYIEAADWIGTGLLGTYIGYIQKGVQEETEP